MNHHLSPILAKPVKATSIINSIPVITVRSATVTEHTVAVKIKTMSVVTPGPIPAVIETTPSSISHVAPAPTEAVVDTPAATTTVVVTPGAVPAVIDTTPSLSVSHHDESTSVPPVADNADVAVDSSGYETIICDVLNKKKRARKG